MVIHFSQSILLIVLLFSCLLGRIDALIKLPQRILTNYPKSPRSEIMQTKALSPLKVMVFVDGTWLYYSLVSGRGNEKGDLLRRKLGANWQTRYSIEWSKFPKLIADNLSSQLRQVGALRHDVEISRTTVFTSLRADTSIMDPREMMISQFHRANFDVHR